MIFKFVGVFLLGVLLSIIVFLGITRKELPYQKEQIAHEHHEHEEEKSSGLTLSETKLKAGGIKIEPVKYGIIYDKLKVAGITQVPQTQKATVSSPVSGKILTLYHKAGESVNKGDAVFAMESLQVQEARNQYLQAEAHFKIIQEKFNAKKQEDEELLKGELVEANAEVALAVKNLDRAKELVKDGIISKKEYDIAYFEFEKAKAKLLIAKRGYKVFEQELFEAKIARDSAANNLKLIENKLYASQQASTQLNIPGKIFVNSPISGIIADYNISLGQYVEPNTALITILSLDPIWIVIDIYENDFSKIKLGQEVNIKSAAYPELIFNGKIDAILPQVEPHVRTAKAYVKVANNKNLLKANMFVEGEIVLQKHSFSIVIPHSSVIVEDGKNIVYKVAKRETVLNEINVHFEPAPVILGIAEGEKYEITSGLKDGDLIVTEGGFYLKSERKKELIEDDHH